MKYSKTTTVDEAKCQLPIEQNLYMRLVLYKLKKSLILENNLDPSVCIFRAVAGYNNDDFIYNKISVCVSAFTPPATT